MCRESHIPRSFQTLQSEIIAFSGTSLNLTSKAVQLGSEVVEQSNWNCRRLVNADLARMSKNLIKQRG